MVSPALKVVGLGRPELKPVELVYPAMKQEAPTSISGGSSQDVCMLSLIQKNKNIRLQK
jgi:hypothetical protein